ncbi:MULTISPECIES: YutD family protein [Exiguobacterium]|uniref:Uncharacterized protein conserved in bacteria n=1 Tax=Exiguobacterium aurantiacum TaxID=33987 RepID=A0A377FTH2_9BACL|nr:MULTISPECIES: YutD family protein [Exiguobacterium]STO07623.1 Uncharacterized protein conserved in bacteria [Exiguobacterium aurantiacum]
MIRVNRHGYTVIEEKRDGFDEEAFIARYSDVLDKYDYIVGDWGHGQLRLKGFYEAKSKFATYDNRIDHVMDYVYEYCNFGCPFFVLKKETEIDESEDGPVFGGTKQPLKLKRKFKKTGEAETTPET